MARSSRLGSWLSDPFVDPDMDAVACLLADRLPQRRLDREPVGAITLGHQGTVERLAIDDPSNLHEPAGACARCWRIAKGLLAADERAAALLWKYEACSVVGEHERMRPEDHDLGGKAGHETQAEPGRRPRSRSSSLGE